MGRGRPGVMGKKIREGHPCLPNPRILSLSPGLGPELLNKCLWILKLHFLQSWLKAVIQLLHGSIYPRTLSVHIFILQSFWERSLSCHTISPQDPQPLIQWPGAHGYAICCRLSHALWIWGLQNSPAWSPSFSKEPCEFLPFLVCHACVTVCLSYLTFSATVIPAMAMPSLPIRVIWACSLCQPGLLGLRRTGLVLGPRRPWSMQQTSHAQHCPGTLPWLFFMLSSSQPKTHFINQCSFSKLEPLWSRLNMCPHCKWLLFPITYASLSHHAICSLHAGLQELFAPNHWQPLSKLKPSA